MHCLSAPILLEYPSRYEQTKIILWPLLRTPHCPSKVATKDWWSATVWTRRGVGKDVFMEFASTGSGGDPQATRLEVGHLKGAGIVRPTGIVGPICKCCCCCWWVIHAGWSIRPPLPMLRGQPPVIAAVVLGCMRGCSSQRREYVLSFCIWRWCTCTELCLYFLILVPLHIFRTTVVIQSKFLLECLRGIICSFVFRSPFPQTFNFVRKAEKSSSMTFCYPHLLGTTILWPL